MAALVVTAHGSHKNPDSARPAFDHADRIRDSGAFGTVRAAFWKEQPHLREALRTLAADEVYVVPLFVSEGYFTEEIIPRELRLEGWDPAAWDSDGLDATAATFTATDTDKTVHYCGPVGTHESMSDVIVRRAEAVTGDSNVGPDVGLAVVGHGTDRNAHSAKAIEYHVERIRELGRFAEVRALFMDEEPEVENLPGYFETTDVVLVPLFVADGYHTQEDIPEEVGLVPEGSAPGNYEIPAYVREHRVWYAGAVGTEPMVASVILARAAEAGADVTPASLKTSEYGGHLT